MRSSRREIADADAVVLRWLPLVKSVYYSLLSLYHMFTVLLYQHELRASIGFRIRHCRPAAARRILQKHW